MLALCIMTCCKFLVEMETLMKFYLALFLLIMPNLAFSKDIFAKGTHTAVDNMLDKLARFVHWPLPVIIILIIAIIYAYRDEIRSKIYDLFVS